MTTHERILDFLQSVLLTQTLICYLPAHSLNVTAHGKATLNTGDTLSLSCTVGADDYSLLGLEVTWLTSGSRLLAHMDRNGVVSNGSGMDPATATWLKRMGEGEFRLMVPAVEASDAGTYFCRVQAWVRVSGGGWYQAAEKTSNQLQVRVINLGEWTWVLVGREGEVGVCLQGKGGGG